MKEYSRPSSHGGALAMLGTAFVVLKLCKIINWSWWLVLLPFYGGTALLVLGFGIFLIFSKKQDD
jgi:hypothetical protein